MIENNKEELSEWCVSNNPRILKKNKDVKELMSDLCEREEYYMGKMAECEERAKRSIKIYQGKINRIHKVMQRLAEEDHVAEGTFTGEKSCVKTKKQ